MLLSEYLTQLQYWYSIFGDIPVWIKCASGHFELQPEDVSHKSKCVCGECERALRKHNLDRIEIETDYIIKEIP